MSNGPAVAVPAAPPSHPSDYCFTGVPSDAHALVIAGTEHPTPAGMNLLNWGDSSVSHPNTDPHPAECRAISDVTAIVLHETDGWGDNPSNVTGPSAAHFYVHTDGMIAQHYDAVQRTQHANKRNSHSIGIEFYQAVHTGSPQGATQSASDPNQWLPPSTARDRSLRDTIPWWGGGNHRYFVPPLSQLEALYNLFELLLTQFATIPDNWLLLDPWTKANISPLPSDSANLFLMWRWRELFDHTGTIPGSNPAIDRDRPGIYSHFAIAGGSTHTDGSFQALYAWLRRKGRHPAATTPGTSTRRALTSQEAFDAAKDLISSRTNSVKSARKMRWYHEDDAPVFFMQTDAHKLCADVSAFMP